ncbi:MAG TPA: 30S ribosome-binding factor RbfA [Stellaceae bacterium]|nr:30S ribosome-binding factor RbfA [Stellaceae bacterium]
MPKRAHPKHERHPEPSQRQLRVGEELRHVLARVLQRGELRDPALQDVTVTVTEVRVSPDLKNATAYVMPLGGRHTAEVIAGLTRSAGYLRSQVARDVPLRSAPSLVFALDTSFDHASRINELLHRPEVERDLAPREAETEEAAEERDASDGPDDGA